jgi:DNA polymerase III subunit gamma/tau
MSTQVLARKWRPRGFAELVGQEHVVRALTNALNDRRLHHAYLFTGTRGVGKTTLARIVAKSLNCDEGVSATPCGTCRACSEIDAGRFVDLIELDAASHTQVDNMRELLENALYAPTAGRYKVYIIDEVHMLSRNAFNAMLKTLEEPPEHVKFVLATTDPQRIPVTVLSRCLQFNLKQVPPVAIQERLARILEAEGVPSEPAALAAIARAAQGSVRDALSLLDQAIAHGGGTVEAASTRVMLGAVDQTYLHSILRALAAGDGAALIAEADRMAERSLSFETALQELGTMVHRLALGQLVPATLSDEEPEAQAMRELAELFTPEELQLHYQIAVQARSEIGLAPDEYAGFTMALLRMLAFAPAAPGTAERAGAPTTSGAPLRAARSVAAPRPAAQTPVSEVAPASADPVDAPASERALPPPGAADPAPLESAVAPPAGSSWAEIIEAIGVSGMARMLAQHCEFVRFEANRLELRLPKTHERLLEKSYQERLRSALRRSFGAGLELSIAVGESRGTSPVALAERERERQQARAVAEIEQDPFVRELVENFDARVNESSIKPLH